MRVLHINSNYPATLLHQTMIDHLNAYTENFVFAAVYDKEKAIVQEREYVTLSECFRKWDRLFFHLKQNKILSAVEKNYRIETFDCIHAYTLFTDGDVARRLSKKHKIPYVVAIRNTDVNLFFKRMIHLRSTGVRILEEASAVFFLSPAYKDEVLQNYVPAKIKDAVNEKSYIIPNGIDDFWHKHLFQRDARRIEERLKTEKLLRCIYVGRIDANKNIGLTLRALDELNAGGWKCSLKAVGDIKDKRIYEAACKSTCFAYYPQKEKEKLMDFYRNADIFIMPSHHESFGLVYAEAMSQGLPVVYTRGQGFDGQFEDGAVGFAVSDREYGECITALERIANDYSQKVRNCLESCGRFNWSSIANEYADIYDKIVSESG